MNHDDAWIFLAQDNAKYLRPLREEDVKDSTIPYFHVRKDLNGVCGYSIDMFNYENHDNSPRMPYYCNYLLKNVFPNIDNQCNLSGYYQIELHDSYTYLDNGKDYKNVLTFAKRKQDKYPVLIPDPFMLGNYGGRLSIKDPYAFEQKASKVGFYGVTTGNRKASLNQRLQLANWSVSNRDFTDFHITGIAQMSVDDVLSAYPSFKEDIYRPPVNQQEQYKYKYLMSVDGNTCSYDRLCWIMKSNSLLFKYVSDEILFYYPLLLENTHFVSVNKNNLKNKFTYYENNPRETNNIIMNGTTFVDTFLQPCNTIMYLTYLFENFAENGV
jgi:hypothetical protein